MYNQKPTFIQSTTVGHWRAEAGLESALHMHVLRDEVGCWDCVDRIGQVIGINNDGVFADQVQSEAVGVDIAFGDVWKWSALEGIPENNLSHRINRSVQKFNALGLLTTAPILAATSALTIASPRCTTCAPWLYPLSTICVSGH